MMAVLMTTLPATKPNYAPTITSTRCNHSSTNPSGGNYWPAAAGNLASITSVVIPDFPDNRRSSPQAPLGDVSNQILRDVDNAARQPGIPGAYATTNDSQPSTTPTP
jgi:hypothetical protein